MLTLRKIVFVTLEERARDFYLLLRSCLEPEENLKCKDHCFRICGNNYIITYCLEGYKKRADRMGTPEDIKLIRRMSCETAFYELFNLDNFDFSEMQKIMNSEKAREEYPNPADRFVASVNIIKQETKNKPLFV